MANNKNVVEDALFQIRNLEETLQENAKGILQSTMTEEIRQLVKESLKEQEDEVENDEVVVDDQDMMDDDEMAMDDDEMMDDDEVAMDDDEMAMDDDETIDMTGASDEEVLKVFKAMGDEDGIIVKKEGGNIHLQDGDDEYMIQLGESEEEEETIYEIEMDEEEDEFVGLEDEISEFNWGGAAMGAVKGGLGLDEEETIYEIEMDDEMMEEDEIMEMDDYMMEMDDEMMEMDDEMMEMDDYMMESKKSVKPKGVGIGRGPRFSYDKKPNMGGGFNEKRKEAFGKGTKAMGTGKARFEYKEEKEWGSKKGEYKRKKEGGVEKKAGMEGGHYKDYMKKKETKEASRTLGNGSNDGSRGLRKARTNNRNMSFNPFKLHENDGEMNLLREKNEEYRKALDVFRTKLNEVAVFNSNLAYATRLFTEHSTTKQEKINILKRFDNVESLKESKNLYRTIKNELNSGSASETKLNESIERTVNRTVETGSSVNLIESKTYENPQFLRMKDLMSKL